MSAGCDHKFVGPKTCAKCGVHIDVLRAESARELAALSPERAATQMKRMTTCTCIPASGVPWPTCPEHGTRRPLVSHDFELEPSDDSIAALQHEVAVNRNKCGMPGCREEQHEVRKEARSQVLAALANARPTATEWLVAAARAMEAYEIERELEGHDAGGTHTRDQ